MELYLYDQLSLDKSPGIFVTNIRRTDLLSIDQVTGRVSARGLVVTARAFASFEDAKRALVAVLQGRLERAAERLTAVQAIERAEFSNAAKERAA